MGLTNIQESFSQRPQHPSAGQCTIVCIIGCDFFTTKPSPTYGVLQVADGLLIIVDLYSSGISYIIFSVCSVNIYGSLFCINYVNIYYYYFNICRKFLY
jgi:hypothetical protein